MGTRDPRIHVPDHVLVLLSDPARTACGKKRDRSRLSSDVHQVTCAECATELAQRYRTQRDALRAQLLTPEDPHTLVPHDVVRRLRVDNAVLTVRWQARAADLRLRRANARLDDSWKEESG